MIDFICGLLGIRRYNDDDRYDYDEDPEIRDIIRTVRDKLKRSGE